MEKFTVQAINSDSKVCGETYHNTIGACQIWSTEHSKGCACSLFIVKNSKGALTYLQGCVKDGLINSWKELKYPEIDIPWVKPTWGIFDVSPVNLKEEI